jgi:uncharacterized integral membrane protein
MDIRKIVAFLLIVLLGVFVFMNRDDARVWFFGIRAEMPIALLVITAGGIGMAVGFLLTFVRGRKKSGADAA